VRGRRDGPAMGDALDGALSALLTVPIAVRADMLIALAYNSSRETVDADEPRLLIQG
jgi:hypothetical protein